MNQKTPWIVKCLRKLFILEECCRDLPSVPMRTIGVLSSLTQMYLLSTTDRVGVVDKTVGDDFLTGVQLTGEYNIRSPDWEPVLSNLVLTCELDSLG